MAKGLFITATDTGAGKTYVAERLIKQWRAEGLSVGPCKPIETGAINKGKIWIGEDCEQLRISAGLPVSTRKLINTYLLKAPTAPLIAARLERKTISIQRILTNIRKLETRFDCVIVEGAGGLMVPIKSDYLMIDLIKAIDYPVILVVPNQLGAINHTLLSFEALKKRGIAIKGYYLNNINHNQSFATRTNLKVIKEFSQIRCLGCY